MTEAPPLPKRPTDEDYLRRDTAWHLKELAEIMRAAKQGRRVNVRANLGRAVEP